MPPQQLQSLFPPLHHISLVLHGLVKNKPYPKTTMNGLRGFLFVWFFYFFSFYFGLFIVETIVQRPYSNNWSCQIWQSFLISKYLLMLFFYYYLSSFLVCLWTERIWRWGDGGIKFSLYKIPNILFWVQVIDIVILHLCGSNPA